MSNLNFRGALEPRSNRATFKETIRFVDDGVLLNLSAATEITVSIADHNGDIWCGPWRLQAKLTTGSVVREASVGLATFTFTAEQMRGLRSGTYLFGVLVTTSSGISQALLKNLPIVEGL